VSGLPTGTTASFDPGQATTVSTITLLTSSTTPPGTYQLQISGTAGTLARNCTFPLIVTPPADFQVAVGPSSQQASPGGQAIYTVTIPMSGGFSQPVTLSVTGLPPGATFAFAPQGNTQVLTVTLAANTAPASGPSRSSPPRTA
jgi:serine protease AprX